MKKNLIFGIFAMLTLTLMANEPKPSNKKSETMVVISTEYGDMKIKLYDETPLHRDNFIKLAKEGFFYFFLFY